MAKITGTRKWRRAAIVLIAVVAVSAALIRAYVPGLVLRLYNGVASPPPYVASPEAQGLHDSLFVADLHCDALMWCRNLLERDTRGHVDVPRMLDGNVAIEVFYAVTRVPLRMKMQGNSAGVDALGLLNFAQGWPVATWYSPRARALHMAGLLEDAAQRSNGALRLVRTRQDLERYVAYRKENPHVCAALLGVEGLYCIEDDLDNVRVLFDAGYRVMGLTHFHDNSVAGSAHGIGQGGLTRFGRDVFQSMEQRKIVPDLAHLSEQAVDDVLEMATRPVLVSHTGLRSLRDSPRNLSDAHARRIAETGGVIGIGFWEEAVGACSVDAIVRSILYGVHLVGADHIALGSDFDGSVIAPCHASGMALITEGLMKAGFAREEIEKIMGGNVLRLFGRVLPDEVGIARSDATSVPN